MSDTEISMLDHCTDRQLKELLALASTSVRATRNWLLEIGDSERLEHLLTEMCTGAEQSGDALLQAVCSPDTPVEALVAIKSVAKCITVAAEAPPKTPLPRCSIACRWHPRWVTTAKTSRRKIRPSASLSIRTWRQSCLTASWQPSSKRPSPS